MLARLLNDFIYAVSFSTALWPNIPFPRSRLPHWRLPWHTTGGIPQQTYDELVRYTQYSSAVYQPLCPNPLGNALVTEFTNLLTGVHGFVARDDEREEVVVAFRGSQQIPDMFTDANMILIPLDSVVTPANGSDDARVHAGFGVAFGSVGDLVLDTVTEQLREHPAYTVILTGHSMGGALAAIGGAMIKSNTTEAYVRVFTFGQPRTGNAAFADLLEELVGSENLYRAVHTWDGVPAIIPQSLGYRHHSTEYWNFQEPPNRKNVRRCTGQEDPACSSSIPSTGINVAHDVYFGQVMTTDATLCL
ncbi:alpha/beta-hydrolase [Peniophora sp. CONT]|nr:alpha/beta-hydrolase [Peniophora sp. CONT]